MGCWAGTEGLLLTDDEGLFATNLLTRLSMQIIGDGHAPMKVCSGRPWLSSSLATASVGVGVGAGAGAGAGPKPAISVF